MTHERRPCLPLFIILKAAIFFGVQVYMALMVHKLLQGEHINFQKEVPVVVLDLILVFIRLFAGSLLEEGYRLITALRGILGATSVLAVLSLVEVILAFILLFSTCTAAAARHHHHHHPKSLRTHWRILGALQLPQLLLWMPFTVLSVIAGFMYSYDVLFGGANHYVSQLLIITFSFTVPTVVLLLISIAASCKRAASAAARGGTTRPGVLVREHVVAQQPGWYQQRYMPAPQYVFRRVLPDDPPEYDDAVQYSTSLN